MRIVNSRSYYPLRWKQRLTYFLPWGSLKKYTFYPVFFPSYSLCFIVRIDATFPLPTKLRTIVVPTETVGASSTRRSTSDSQALFIGRLLGCFLRLTRWRFRLITDNTLIAVFKRRHPGAVVRSVIQIAWTSTNAANTARVRVVI